MIYEEKQREEDCFVSVNNLIQPRKEYTGFDVALSSPYQAQKQEEQENNKNEPKDPTSKKSENPSKGPKDNKHFYTKGIWNNMGNDYLEADLGQVVWITVKNINVLGTTIEIEPNYGDKQVAVILPLSSVEFRFDLFAEEPVHWKFNVSSYSDAFIVGYTVRSTWIPGMAPNPPKNNKGIILRDLIFYE